MSRQFVVEAIDEQLACVRLQLSAPSSEHARAQALDRGAQVVRVRRDWWGELRSAMASRPFPAALFFRELALLVRAGLTLDAAFTSLQEKEKNPANALIIEGVCASVSNGASFSEALAQYPRAFSAVACAAVEAAEGADALADVLDRVSEHLEQAEQLRRRVIGAVLYPALIVVVGVLVTAYLMLFVVPQFAQIYEQLGPNIPWLANILVGWAKLLSAHTWAAYAVLGMAALVLGWASIDRRLRSAAFRWIQRLKVIELRYRLFLSVQFYRGLAMLLASGTSLPRALSTLEGNATPALAAQIRAARGAIDSGKEVSEALLSAGLASQVSVRLIAAGERSGSMVIAVTRIAQMLERDLDRDVQWLLKVLEPMLMLAVGVVVGAVVLLMYLPIFELASAIG